MPKSALETYREALKTKQEREQELADRDAALNSFVPLGQVSSNTQGDNYSYDEALNEAIKAQKILKLKEEEAKVNEKARKLNDNKFSDFNLTDPTNDDNYDDVVSQYLSPKFGGQSILPKAYSDKLSSNEIVYTPEDIAKLGKEQRPIDIYSTLNDSLDQIVNKIPINKQVANAGKAQKIFDNKASPINTPKDLLDKYQAFKSPKIEVSKDLLSNTPANTEPDYSKQDSDEGFNDLANPNLAPTIQPPYTKYHEITDPYRKSEVSEQPKDSSTSETTKPLSLDEQLAQAQRNRDIIAAIGTMGKGFEKMSAGMGGGSITQLKPDYAAQESFIKSGDQKVEDIKNLIKAAQEARKAEQETTYKNAQVAKLNAEVKKLKEEGDSGGWTPEKRANYELKKGFLQVAQNNLEQGKTREGRLEKSNQFKAVQDVLDKTKVYKDFKDREQAYGDIDSMLEQVKSGNQAAAASIGAKLAKAMGEVGVLTDQDVKRYLGDKSWARSLQSWYYGGMKGTLPPGTIKDIKNNIDEIREGMKARTNKIYEDAGSRVQSLYPELDTEYINKIMGRPGYVGMKSTEGQQTQPSQSKGQYPKTVRKNGQSTTVESEAEEKEARAEGWN